MNKHRKIALTGIAGGGKSVFLTSLLWHIAEFEDSDFILAQNAEVSGWRELPQNTSPKRIFPFEKYRDALSRAKDWPEKTTDCFDFCCEYRRSDWKHFSQRLTFFDFPGERIADAAIAAFKSYEQWSDHILKHYKNSTDYTAALSEYFKTLDAAAPAKEQLINCYKTAMAGLILGYKPLVTPSVFLLDQAGKPVQPGTEQAIANSRLCGLTQEKQFCPLSAEFRESNKELVKEFTRYYKEYRKQVALPLFEKLSETDCLIILIDIPSLLAGGVGRYNDNRQMVLDLIESLNNNTSVGKMLRKIIKFWSRSLSKIAFVGSKADLILPADIESGQMESLLRQMNTRAKNLLIEKDVKWFICSACRSTIEGKSPNSLIGKLTYNNPQRDEMEFEVSPLPEGWPSQWQANQYKYYSVFPETSQNVQIPPKHLGLDRIFAFITG